jgi:PAS domain S-box-containing protein
MNYMNMTKEDLVNYIEEMKSKRAFTYEDQMKLIILDASPFTVWTSDRNCIIRLWTGQCEALYGYNSEEVVGKDYIDLFVASDEKLAARRDQINIIDNAAKFHNIANDIGKNGNTLQLVTNCCRIKDPVTGEYWNAEMGLIIDYLDQEKERLKLIVNESQRISSCVSHFIEDTFKIKGSFTERKSSLNKAIRNCEKKAIALKKRTAFKKHISCTKAALLEASDTFNTMIDEYYSQIQHCASYESCEETRLAFIKKYEEISDSFEDIVLDIEELSRTYDVDDNFVAEKDILIRDIASDISYISQISHDITQMIEQEISDYRNQINPNPDYNASPLKDFIDMKDCVLAYKSEFETYATTVLSTSKAINKLLDLKNIKLQVDAKFEAIEQQLINIKNKL